MKNYLYLFCASPAAVQQMAIKCQSAIKSQRVKLKIKKLNTENTNARIFNLKMLCLPFFQATTVNKYAAQIIIIIFAHLISH